jgi:hypothetical protein
MGIYSTDRYFGGSYTNYAAEIPANEAYGAAFGCAHVLADCQVNDMALFESAIYDDMAEVMSLQEGYQVVNENAFTNVIKKIVEMFKRLVAKIKGIFKSFIAKLYGVFKSGKDLVKKYEKQILKYHNWKEFKLKNIRKPKNNGNTIRDKVDSLFAIHISNNYNIPSIDKTDWPLTTKILNKTEKEISDMDAEDLRIHIIKEGGYLSGVNISNFGELSELVTDHLWDDEDTLDGDDDKISSSFFTTAWIKGVLEDDKWKKDVEKTNKNCEDKINKIIDDLKKIDDKLAKEVSDKKINADDRVRMKSGNPQGFNLADSSKTIGKDDRAQSGYKDFELSDKMQKYSTDEDIPHKMSQQSLMGSKGATYGDIQKYIHALQKVASNEQEVITKVTSEYMSQVKFAIAQAKKIWSAAASYSSTTHKEDASYYQALGECAAEQVYSYIESL